MTKEELEKEADEYATENYEQCIYDDVIGWKTDYEARKQAYLAGAEPREKQIQIDAEQIRALQKQNGELTDRVKELEEKLEQTEKDLADYQFNYPTIKELEKENAELKHTIAELRRDKDNLNTHTKVQEKLSEYRSDQLTKAKEILHKVCYEFGIYDKDLMEEAKQFLKELDNDKEKRT